MINKIKLIIIVFIVTGCSTQPTQKTSFELFADARLSIRKICSNKLLPENKQRECYTNMLNSYINELYSEVRN